MTSSLTASHGSSDPKRTPACALLDRCTSTLNQNNVSSVKLDMLYLPRVPNVLIILSFSGPGDSEFKGTSLFNRHYLAIIIVHARLSPTSGCLKLRKPRKFVMKYHCLSTAVILWMAVTVSAASGQALQYEKGICSAFPPEFVRFDGENSALNPDGRLALMAAASSSELASARKAYWQSYASGQPDEQARRKYARLLSAKDMF